MSPSNLTFEIERIAKKEFSVFSSLPAGRSILGAIKRELISDVDLDKFIERYDALLDIDHQDVRENPYLNSRGTEIYKVALGEEIIGLLFVNFYSWNILAPQLCIKVESHNSHRLFSLKPFAELVNHIQTPELASELFIMWVKPAYRGAGIGRAMFAQAIKVMNDFLTPGDIGFLTVRSGLTKRASTILFQYLLDVEKKAHGTNLEGKVITSGIGVSVENIRMYTGLNYKSIPIHPAAAAMKVLTEQAGFQFAGYSNKSSTIYIKVW